MSKALIKNTGQILNIENEYGVFYKKVEIELNDREFSEATNVTEATEKAHISEEGRWFLLSDGKKYHKSDLVVGQEEIREYQLNKIV